MAMSLGFARSLRRNATDAERTLWRMLRNRRLNGRKFRRQQRMGRYIVDFVCQDARLVVELDGGQHANDTPERTQSLEGAGYRVLRFWNNDVLNNLDGVLQTIETEVSERL